MSDKDRIKQYLDYKGISKNKFYVQTGFSVGFLDSGNSLGVDKARIIINTYPDISLDWLIMGEGDMLRSDVETQTHTAVEPTMDGGIPLIPIDAMAGMFQGEQSVLLAECERYFVPAFKSADFLITVRGDSMQPRYYSGDIVACKNLSLSDIFFQWGKVYVVDTEQGSLIKKVEQGAQHDTITLVSENPLYKPFEIARKSIYHIALVLGVIRAE